MTQLHQEFPVGMCTPHTRLCEIRDCPPLEINPLISFTDFSFLVSFCFYRAWPSTHLISKFKFWLIPPKHPFRGTISRNDIKKSPSALHFENFRKVRKFAKNTFFNSENGCKFQQISTKQYKRAKAPIDLILLMYLADIHSFKTP